MTTREESEEIPEPNHNVPEQNDNGSDRPAKGFGSRRLVDPDRRFDFNAWDHVEWGDDQIRSAEERISCQEQVTMAEDDKEAYTKDSADFWDSFYTKNNDKFFKNRNWLMTEFPDFYQCCQVDSGEKRIFEVGCGAGNTV